MKILSILVFLLSCLMLFISIHDLVEYPSDIDYPNNAAYKYVTKEINYATQLISSQPTYNTPIYNSGGIIGYETHKIENVNFIGEMREDLSDLQRYVEDQKVSSVFQAVISAIFFLYTLFIVLNTYFSLSFRKK